MNSSFSILFLLALTSSIVTAEAEFKCGEKRTDVFFYLKDVKTGIGKEKNCGWLKTQKRKILKKACKQRETLPNGLPTAKRVCPSVCGRPCPPGPTLEPSAVPSFEPTSTPSSAPSITPSAAPSISSQPTLGFCIGDNACNDSLNLFVSPNSCRGDYSCHKVDYAVVKEGSCHGTTSCTGAKDLEAGPNSCRGKYSCEYVINAVVKEGSCHGKASCNGATDLEAGPNSCRGESSCFDASGRIGSNSCNCATLPGTYYDGCCKHCSSRANVPDDACNTDDNGVPVNAEDFTDDGKCKYCV